MLIPQVVIVGRPNVGKSSLFNRIIGKRVAVVMDRDGVTRDRHFHDVEWRGKFFQLVDTGGFLPKSINKLDILINEQIEMAIREASVILFVTDGQTGITDLDMSFAKLLHKANAPVLLTVNKTESESLQTDIHSFWNLGMGNPWAVSALHGKGVYDLLDEAADHIKMRASQHKEEKSIQVAILGRPNAGKSTLVNRLLGENRVIVSEEPGTTRDSIDTNFEYMDHHIILTDTAGLRKKMRVKDDVEKYSNQRALEAMRRSDICILLFDINRGIEVQDLRILTLIQEAGKGVIICLNKWDLMEPDSKMYDSMLKEIYAKIPDFEWVPIIALSGLMGKRINRLLEEILKVHQNLKAILGRDNVIEFFNKIISSHPHPYCTKGMVNFTRCCQIMLNPPALALETSKPENVEKSYEKFFRRKAQEHFKLIGVPLKIYFRRDLDLRTDEELNQYLTRLA